MKTTHYYLASVANATGTAVRLCVNANNSTTAFAEAAIRLANAGLEVTQLQSLTYPQWEAMRVPFHTDVALRPGSLKSNL